MKEDAQLIIESEVSGEQFRATRYTVDSDYFLASDGWTARVNSKSDPAGLRRKLQPLTPVKLYVNERHQLTGRIYDTEGEGGGNTGLDLTGRDYIADIADPDINPSVRLTEEMTFEKALQTIFGPYGITKFSGNFDRVRNVRTGISKTTRVARTDFEALKVGDLKPNDNEGLYQFAQKFVARHGYTIQPGLARDEIFIVAPQLDQDVVARLTAGRNGELLPGKAKRDWTNAPTHLVGTGRPSTREVEVKQRSIEFSGRTSFFSTGLEITPKTTVETKQVTRATSVAMNLADTPFGVSPEVKRIFGNVRQKALGPGDTRGLLEVYRPIYHKDRHARSEEQLLRGMLRLASDKLRSTLAYSAAAAKHTIGDTGKVFAIDTLFGIYDAVEDVDEVLWLGKVTHAYTETEGARARLSFVRPGTVVI